MIANLKEYFKDQAITALTGPLDGMSSPRLGDINLPTEEQPGFTIDWDGRLSCKRDGNRFIIDTTLAFTAYVSSLEGMEACDSIMEPLLFRQDNDGKYRGLIAWLLGLTGARVGNQAFTFTVDENVTRGTIYSLKASIAQLAAVVRVHARTFAVPKDFQ